MGPTINTPYYHIVDTDTPLSVLTVLLLYCKLSGYRAESIRSLPLVQILFALPSIYLAVMQWQHGFTTTMPVAISCTHGSFGTCVWASAGNTHPCYALQSWQAARIMKHCPRRTEMLPGFGCLAGKLTGKSSRCGIQLKNCYFSSCRCFVDGAVRLQGSRATPQSTKRL
jgi:hypothetical protein